MREVDATENDTEEVTDQPAQELRSLRCGHMMCFNILGQFLSVISAHL